MTEHSIRRAAVYVPKGGVSKTTTCAHVGASAAQDHGLDVVVVDLAGQQNDLATQFGVELPTEEGPDGEEQLSVDVPVSLVFNDQWDAFRSAYGGGLVADMTFDTGEGPDLIPADNGLSGADNNLASVDVEERYVLFDRFVSEHLAPEYDLVLIDLPGKEDNIALNGLYAAENVIATARPGEFERNQIENLERDLAALRDSWGHNPEGGPDADPHIEVVVPTAVRRGINYHEEFVDELEADYPELASEPVRASAQVGDYQREGRTLLEVADGSLYSTGEEAREAWRAATDELLRRVDPA